MNVRKIWMAPPFASCGDIGWLKVLGDPSGNMPVLITDADGAVANMIGWRISGHTEGIDYYRTKAAAVRAARQHRKDRLATATAEVAHLLSLPPVASSDRPAT